MYDLFVCGTNNLDIMGLDLKSETDVKNIITGVAPALWMFIVSGVLFHLVLDLIHLGQSHLEVHVLIPDQEGLPGRFLAQVIRKVDNAIHQINHHPVDSVICFVNT